MQLPGEDANEWGGESVSQSAEARDDDASAAGLRASKQLDECVAQVKVMQMRVFGREIDERCAPTTAAKKMCESL